MLAYHITKKENIEFITAHGLVSGLLDYKNYDITGEGIYVFFDKSLADNVAENLGFDDPILVTTEVDASELLMDEDALYDEDAYGEGIDTDFVEMLFRLVPKNGVEEWLTYIRTHDGQDELPVNDPEVAKFKIGFIDKYQIRPNEDFPTEIMRNDMMTARCITRVLPVLKIEEIYSDDVSD